MIQLLTCTCFKKNAFHTFSRMRFINKHNAHYFILATNNNFHTNYSYRIQNIVYHYSIKPLVKIWRSSYNCYIVRPYKVGGVVQWGTAYLSCVMVVLGKVLHAVGAASIGQTKPAHGVIKLLLTRCV